MSHLKYLERRANRLRVHAEMALFNRLWRRTDSMTWAEIERLGLRRAATEKDRDVERSNWSARHVNSQRLVLRVDQETNVIERWRYRTTRARGRVQYIGFEIPAMTVREYIED